MLLFKVLTNMNESGRQIFLQSRSMVATMESEKSKMSGISALKQFLTKFRGSKATFEVYLYCLGMVPSLLTVSQNFNEDFIDAGYTTLLAR